MSTEDSHEMIRLDATAHDDATLRRLARVIELTADEEIDCTTCLDLVPIYVDRELAGADAAREMPDMQRHLALCGDCSEEYEALRDLAAQEVADDLPEKAALLDRLQHQRP